MSTLEDNIETVHRSTIQNRNQGGKYTKGTWEKDTETEDWRLIQEGYMGGL